jgi:hypothetical protein
MSDLANQVVAHYEQEASLSNHYLDTASLYKMLLHVPSELLKSYLDRNVYSNGVQINQSSTVVEQTNEDLK